MKKSFINWLFTDGLLEAAKLAIAITMMLFGLSAYLFSDLIGGLICFFLFLGLAIAFYLMAKKNHKVYNDNDNLGI